MIRKKKEERPRVQSKRKKGKDGEFKRDEKHGGNRKIDKTKGSVRLMP